MKIEEFLEDYGIYLKVNEECSGGFKSDDVAKIEKIIALARHAIGLAENLHARGFCLSDQKILESYRATVAEIEGGE